MANRRVWSALSQSYQTRLLRNGITQQAYESGASVTAARGHKETPEHPEDAIRNPDKYKNYRKRLKALQQEVNRRKEEIWGNRHKWNDRRAKENVLRGTPPDFKKPGIKALKKAMEASDEQWEVYVAQTGHGEDSGIQDDWSFLYYH